MEHIIHNYVFTEKLGEGPQAIVYKAFHKKKPNRPLTIKILKEVSLSDSKIRLFHQKIEQLKVLDDIHVITASSFKREDNCHFFIQDYYEGLTLDEWTRTKPGARINLDDFFVISCRLAEVLDNIHKTGIIHGGIKPHNILIHPGTLDIMITDFISPFDVRDVSHFIYNRHFVEGTLAYTSPEQTGRINHRVDFTSDLYSAGIMLYELLTGKLPFFSADPLELIHSHLAEEAPYAHELNPEVPAILSKIIARLMLKQPEKRYQSGSGLLADLLRCRDEYLTSGIISEFPLGINDRTHRITFVSKMVGRDRHAKIILEEYAIASQSSFRCLFISGLPGIGKTRLIQELQNPIVEHRGYFTSGKFDVYQKNIPYNSLIQALRNLVRTFLTESDERVTMWRQKINAAVRSNGKVIADVIPELNILIGPQPDVSQLPPVEARNRFHDVFGRFLACLASKETPLVLFIDDLQWCDVASFDFLSNIFENYKEHPYLLLLGAYRHNEVDSRHPLAKLIQSIKEKAQPLKEIRLEPLQTEHCHEMVSYILDSPLSQTEALANFISGLTEGNPLFVSESLSYLYNENLLFLDENRQWRWNLDKIRQSNMPATVVALFSSKVKKLPSDTIALLEYCSCMGNLFAPDEVAMVMGITLLDTFKTLKPALGQGLLMESKDKLQFVHDRVQEAVLSNIEDERKRQIHWQVGNKLFSAVPKRADMEKLDNLFTITSHLNLGRVGNPDKKTAYRLLDINYHAGNSAMNSLATEAANEYYRQSISLLPNDCWNEQYDRTFKIFQKLAKTELMCGRYDHSEKLLNQLLDHAKTDLDKAEALAEQTTSLSSIGNFIKAIETANRGLDFFGKSIPDDPELAEKKREKLMNEIKSQYSNVWDIILNMPFTTERKSKIELAFYSELIPDLYMSGMVPQLYLSSVQSTQHCLEGGMDESVIYSFSIMGLYLGEQGEFEEAFLYEDLARNLSEKYPNTFGATRGMNGVVWCNMHSRSHPEEVVNYCRKSIQCGKNCGDLYNAGLSYGPLMWNLQVQGANLQTIEEYADDCLQFSRKYHLSFSVGLAEAMQAGWIAPMKRNYVPVLMEEKIEKWERDNHIASAGSYYVHMALSSYYFGQHEKAEQYLLEVKRYLTGLTDNVLKRQWHVFLALNALKLHMNETAYKSKEELMSYIQPLIKKIETWAKFGPLLKPFLALIYAEVERATGTFREARNLYFDAMALAHEQRYTFLEGYLNECLGEFLDESDKGTGRVFFIEAVRLYTKCRVERKKVFLLEKYPEYFDEEALSLIPDETVPVSSYTLPSLDVDYLMKSSLAISAEIDPDALQNRIMNVVLEASGAQHGYLLIEENGDLVVCAESHVVEKGAVRPAKYNLNDATDICKAIVRYVHRTREKVLLNNASEEGDFKNNPEVQTMQLRSVLCLPLIKQPNFIGILYLENRLSDSVFTLEKTEMTKLLVSQAAISMENSQLLEDMRKAEKQILASLKEKEVLLKEIHHRVKNNLQVIYSLLNLQSRKIKDKQIAELFRESRNRIRSMAFIHEKLHKSKDLSRIDFAEYIRALLVDLFRSYGANSKAVSVKINADNIPLSIDIALPLGLIINELTSNSLKYAFPSGQQGEISIILRYNDAKLLLIFSDNGVGLSKDFDILNTETLGFQLVITLVEQLEATIKLDRARGTEFRIELNNVNS